jgi:Domain of unknown function (DU1801)
MAELKTTRTKASVTEFLDGISDEQRRRDCIRLVEIMTRATDAKPEMWGPAIVGFGRYRYKYPSGREGEWFVAGFSPRKQNLTLYVMPGFNKLEDLLEKLGNHKTSKACLYIKRLSEVDMSVLEQIVARSYEEAKRQYLK